MNWEVENKLLACENLNDFVAKFLGLSYKDKHSMFTQKVIVEQGREFYRARKASSFDDIQLVDDPEQWGPPPKKCIKKDERFNRARERVLYVATDDLLLGREIGLKDGDEYYVAKYVNKKEFYAGTLFNSMSLCNMLLHRLVMSINNYDELSKDEADMLEDYYKNVKINSMKDLANDMLAPLYIHKIINNLYDKTNKIGNIVLDNNVNAIRYASVYMPLEYSGGVQCLTVGDASEGNYVLKGETYKNLELVGVEKKKYEEKINLCHLIKAVMDEKSKL